MALTATIRHARITRRYKKYLRLMSISTPSYWGMCDTCNTWDDLVSGCWTCVSCHRQDCV